MKSSRQREEVGGAPRRQDARTLLKLSLGALGIVYGDIGTSPLYAIRECFGGSHAVEPNVDNVYGILSLVLWSLVMVVVVKYLTFIMRADNRGEGGILALFALLIPKGTLAGNPGKKTVALLMAGLFGAGLLFGDGMITPVISVLGAVEGLEFRTDVLKDYVVPIAIVILIALFLVQRHGTGGIGRIFGWIMLLWFLAISAAGIHGISTRPAILLAVSPVYAVEFFVENGLLGFSVLGAVVLVITGAEALYADMGHFGRVPIRTAWYFVVMPALLLNYFGQGALLLGGDPVVLKNPFYALTPGWTLYPMLVLATMAAVIASQALISGVFSLTQQAVQLGYWPRVRIVHTSGEAVGQIYIPEMNWILMVACVALVLVFQSSSGLAAAYGIAVTGTMIITSLLFYAVARTKWGWSGWKAGALLALFLLFDVGFFAANVDKIPHGGWFPLAVGLVLFVVFTTWRRGRLELARVKGTAVFMTSNVEGAPIVLLHHFKHNKVLHEKVVLLSIVTERVPAIPRREMVEVHKLAHGFYQVIARVGFMQQADVPEIMQHCRNHGLQTQLGDTSFYLGRETLLVTGPSRMARWRKMLFSALSRNSRPATAFFGLPPNRVVEIGAQIEL